MKLLFVVLFCIFLFGSALSQCTTQLLCAECSDDGFTCNRCVNGYFLGTFSFFFLLLYYYFLLLLIRFNITHFFPLLRTSLCLFLTISYRNKHMHPKLFWWIDWKHRNWNMWYAIPSILSASPFIFLFLLSFYFHRMSWGIELVSYWWSWVPGLLCMLQCHHWIVLQCSRHWWYSRYVPRVRHARIRTRNARHATRFALEIRSFPLFSFRFF